MLLSEKDQERLHNAIQANTEAALETHTGMCIAVDGETGQEWGYKWRNGVACVRIGPDEDDEGEEPEVEYVYAVRVELVAVVRVGD